MNERIKELWNYAADTTKDDSWESQSAFIEEFAKLIVRECAEIALEQKKWVEDQEVFNPQDEQWNRARIQQSQHIVDKIREYFGVEE